MKVMVISDLHFDKRVIHGIDESKVWSWLLGIVDYHKPDLLLSCGDWGTAINYEGFYDLLKRTIVLSIYGNHENLDVLSRLYNVKTESYLPVLMEDGRLYEISKLRIAGVNGNIHLKKRTRKGVPRGKPDDFLDVAEKLRKIKIDVLLVHETSYLPEQFPFMRDSVGARTSLKLIETVKPKLVFNGHKHSGGIKFYNFPWDTKYLYIDSSQAHKHYVLFYPEHSKIEVWRDLELFKIVDVKMSYQDIAKVEV